MLTAFILIISQKRQKINNGINLYEAAKKGEFTVTSVPDIGLLESLGIRVGSKITVQNRYILGGPVLLRVEGAYSVALGKDIAKQINEFQLCRNDVQILDMPANYSGSE